METVYLLCRRSVESTTNESLRVKDNNQQYKTKKLTKITNNSKHNDTRVN
jgi:hypothetical protein